MAKYKKMVIGIDQSYNNTGISVFCDKKKKYIGSIRFSSDMTKTQKRYIIYNKLETFLRRKINMASEVIIIVERIRQFSGGFVSMDYIKSTGALIATIVDVGQKYGIKTYSVDTRAWKSKIVGNSKPQKNKYGINSNKWPTILYIKQKGWLDDVIKELPSNSKKEKGVLKIDGKKYIINDDACDSACIALYGFLPKSEQNLKEEQ